MALLLLSDVTSEQDVRGGEHLSETLGPVNQEAEPVSHVRTIALLSCHSVISLRVT